MVAGGQRLSFRYNDLVTIQLLSRQTTELYCMVIYWWPDEYLYDIIFLYYVRTQTAKLPCTYKLRPVIPASPRFPDASATRRLLATDDHDRPQSTTVSQLLASNPS